MFMKKVPSILLWIAVAMLGAFAVVSLAIPRGEHVNSLYILTAALCSYALGYRFYSKWIAARVLAMDDLRATPCEVHEDGHEYVKTNKWIVFGHHFAAISGPGPLMGPVLAAQFGFLPGTLWILIGAVLGGAVQDFVILFCSMRRDGKSLGQMVKEELNSAAGLAALVAILGIMVILLAVLALVIVRALAESPWGVFTVGLTIPIAMFMGGYLRWLRPGKVLEISLIGVVLLLGAVWGGQFVHSHAGPAAAFKFEAEPLAWMIIGYGVLASVLPVWLLLAPRDYLSTFMKLGTIFSLAVGVALVLPDLQMPPVTKFIDGTGLVVAGKLFPFCFITIACGAISGFHTLISSGITPKIITRERLARPVGYGAMCLESLVAIMALIAACTLDPGVYLAMNVKGAGATPAVIAADTVAKVNAQGAIFHVEPAQMDALAKEVGESTLYGRIGGAATLAVGMAKVFSRVSHGRWLDLWYHFAIMFEALFILTTLDAGTRVGRYLLQDGLGHLWKPLGDVRSLPANALSSGLIVAAWGAFLIQGVRDPLGGINSLWPLFGIANQLLASIALCLATVVILKMALQPRADGSRRSPALCLVTLLPLCWLLTVTFSAGFQKIYDPAPKIGFLSAAASLETAAAPLHEAVAAAQQSGDQTRIAAAEKALAANRALHFNSLLDAWVAGIFLLLVAFVVAITLWECFLLVARRKLAELSETAPVFLASPDTPQPGGAVPALGAIAIGFALLKEFSGQTELERELTRVEACQCAPAEARTARQNVFLAVSERKFRGIRNCC